MNERIQRQEIDWRKERDQLIGRATDLEVEIKVSATGHCNDIDRVERNAEVKLYNLKIFSVGTEKEGSHRKGKRTRNEGQR